MTKAKKSTAEKPAAEAGTDITFQCRVCGQIKPFAEMRVISRLFPPLVVCQDCEGKML